MPTLTDDYDLYKPLPFDLTDADLWGGYLNDNFDKIDGLFWRSLNWNVLSKGGNYTLTTADYHTMINANASTASFTIQLPTAVGNAGLTVAIKKVDATANTVSIQGFGAQTVDGVNNYLLSLQYESVILVSDGANWSAVSTYKVYIPPIASTTTQGIVELATDAEFQAGTDTTRAVTPSNVLNSFGFKKYFQSSPIAYVAGAAQYSVAHGLGAVPKLIDISLQCISPQSGFDAGDEVRLNSNNIHFNVGNYTPWANATNIGWSASNALFIYSKTGNQINPLASNWRLILRAWA